MDFNPVEVFRIAVKMEENGIAFYKKAASFTKDEMMRGIFEDLAEMEENHRQFFAHMERAFHPQGFMDAEEIAQYLARHFDSGIFKSDPAAQIGNTINTLKDIFTFALDREVDSVEYYTLLRDKAKEEDTRKVLTRIISEEEGHVRTIREYLQNA